MSLPLRYLDPAQFAKFWEEYEAKMIELIALAKQEESWREPAVAGPSIRAAALGGDKPNIPEGAEVRGAEFVGRIPAAGLRAAVTLYRKTFFCLSSSVSSRLHPRSSSLSGMGGGP